MKIAFALASCVVLAGCNAGGPAPSAQTPQAAPFTLTAAHMKTIQAGLRSSLKDPDSARFGTMRAVKDAKGDVIVCGYVNAKNSFGGYTGDQPFLGTLSEAPALFLVAMFGGTDSERFAVRKVCGEYGLPV
jgi:hypothetical protein